MTMPTRRLLWTLAPALGLGLGTRHAAAQAETPVKLFRLVTMRGDVMIGLTPRELAGLGEGSDVERIARRIAQQGQITAWRYQVGRAADGGTRLATRDRVAVLRQDALIVEPYSPALPVAAPPAE